MTVSNIEGAQPEKSAIRREIAIIPNWAYVVAAFVLVCIPLVFWFLVFPHDGRPQAPTFVTLVPLVPAIFLAFYVLMIGYVNRDAGRRGMSRALWTIIVMFVPNAIGFILYFVLRSPVRTQCPKCQATVDANLNFCPNCRYNFHPTCPQCKAAIRATDTYCGKCGAQIQTQS